jgi:EAL domain-containing protein (putative c-di-GMP-specific phosphodiesterase class I)
VDQDHVTAVRTLLELAHARLGTDVAWVSRFTADGQVFEDVVETEPGTGPARGAQEPLEGSYCIRVLDGRLPAVVPEARTDARTRDLRVTESLRIGSYVGTPIPSASGRPRGMLCCVSRAGGHPVSDRQLTFLESVARLIAELDALGEEASEHDSADRHAWRRVKDVISGESADHRLRMALQPVVDLRTGALWGLEALARFGSGEQGPGHWFGEADRLGLRCDLEVAAARSALAHLTDLPGTLRLSVNISPEALLGGDLDEDLARTDVSHLVLEVTEHAIVGDYPRLREALEPLRARGMLVAVDDAGAGYASFRHIVRLRPDVIKIDLSLIRDIDSDPVCQSLVTSLVGFAASTGSGLIAEGVETPAELEMLARLGVPSAQGFLLAEPAFEAPPVGARLLPDPSTAARPVPQQLGTPAVRIDPLVSETWVRSDR